MIKEADQDGDGEIDYQVIAQLFFIINAQEFVNMILSKQLYGVCIV